MSDNWYTTTTNSLSGQNPYQSPTVTTTASGGLGQTIGTYPAAISWPPLAQPPTLPIKLNIRELIKLLRALESDEELKGIIQKFQPFIGVDV